MELSMPVVWSDRCLLHEPRAEIWVGVETPAAETPDRIERIRAALRPTVFVQEGGYQDAIGELVRETLLGFEA